MTSTSSSGCCHARVLDEQDMPPTGDHYIDDYPLYYNCLYFPELFVSVSDNPVAHYLVLPWTSYPDAAVIASLSALNNCDLRSFVSLLKLNVQSRDMRNNTDIVVLLLKVFRADCLELTTCSQATLDLKFSALVPSSQDQCDSSLEPHSLALRFLRMQYGGD
jgi:hypothetical protein